MFVQKLSTNNPKVQLIEPHIERDASLSVQWVADPHGRETLRLMGVPAQHNRASTLAQETQRVQDFLDKTDQINWMIELDGLVVGSVWIDLQPSADGTIEAPAVSIMLGSLAARGQGVGSTALNAVVQWWETCATEPALHVRHLLDNQRSAAILRRLGFKNNGQPYRDKDNLVWQNMIYKRSEHADPRHQ